MTMLSLASVVFYWGRRRKGRETAMTLSPTSIVSYERWMRKRKESDNEKRGKARGDSYSPSSSSSHHKRRESDYER